jgi:hypothetical protein
MSEPIDPSTPPAPDDEYDEAIERRRARDTALQHVVDDLVRRSPGRPAAEIRAELEGALADRGLPTMPEGWLDAVTRSAAIGDPYVVSAYAEEHEDVPPVQDHHAGRIIE